uniref:Uncharacterized protein n=1 Tax=Arundo donax TaxID=35708 RepID=A0A0A9TMT5_ARUDO
MSKYFSFDLKIAGTKEKTNRYQNVHYMNKRGTNFA